jgi:hypothetical protein
MTIGTMSALEGDGSSLGGIVQANWYYFFHQKAEGADVFDSTIYFALPASGSFGATEGVDTFSSAGDITAQGSLVVTEDGSDSLLASGVAFLSGELSATESGEDDFTGFGVAYLEGLMAATEAAGDYFDSTGQLLIDGTMSATESGADVLAADGLKPKPVVQAGGGRRMDELQWQPWPLLADEVIRRAKRKRSDILLLLH